MSKPMPNKTLSVMSREIKSYFSSPVAFIFLLTYLGANLYTFFIVEQFFARNIADVKPLFEWMPILLIFLIGTLTMRMWSEERSTGTVEFLLTLPVKTHELVLGKFLACLALVTMALILTLGLPLSVSMMGSLDWGPVMGAYLASILLAAAYIAVGLFVSSRFESQIVSLIVSALVCSILYALGSSTIQGLFGGTGAEILAKIGIGSRFESISRGVLDLRDIFYYVSIAAAFLSLNIYSLEKLKWSANSPRSASKTITTVTVLAVANFMVGNIWLNRIQSARIDMTKNQSYSISEATEQLMDQLQEPLLVRGYFSEKTHPLLAPLIPVAKNFLLEYQLAGKGKVQVEIVNPQSDAEIEAEANRRYGIEPVPFQVQDRHSAQLISGYFNIVVQYGDQHEVLGVKELVEIKSGKAGQSLDVKLRNMEYDITRAAKKTIQSFANAGDFFARMTEPVKMVAYVSENTLPQQVKGVWTNLKQAAEKMSTKGGDKFSVEVVDPTQNRQVAEEIYSQYGYGPQRLSIFSQETFYFYLTLQKKDKIIPLNLEELSVETFDKSLEEGLQRMMPGFLKTVGIYTPPGGATNPMMAQFGHGGDSKKFQKLEAKLGENYTTTSVDLESGAVPSEVDVLLVLAPKDLNDKQIFAIDQFMMKGGSVVMATSPASIAIARTGVTMTENNSGVAKWLQHQGIEITRNFVMDKQNLGFPEFTKRNVQGVMINNIELSPYPLFLDIRDNGLNQESAISSSLGQLTMAWASPIKYTAPKDSKLTYTKLAESSSDSWISEDLTVESNRSMHPEFGFKVGEQTQPSTVVAMLEGEFTSYFKGKASPLVETEKEKSNPAETAEPTAEDEKQKAIVTGVIEKSPAISRLILFSSNDFAEDNLLDVTNFVQGNELLSPLQALENSLDWSTEDRTLLSIRSRGHFAQTLIPMSDDTKSLWEWVNFAIALVGLGAIFAIYTIYHRRNRELYRAHGLMS
ncbi:MAG: Gldg family protein [Zetaproteobacteria bacterium]|nr:Gldg family protein [Zetaproteobacteria bacterium]